MSLDQILESLCEMYNKNIPIFINFEFSSKLFKNFSFLAQFLIVKKLNKILNTTIAPFSIVFKNTAMTYRQTDAPQSERTRFWRYIHRALKMRRYWILK